MEQEANMTYVFVKHIMELVLNVPLKAHTNLSWCDPQGALIGGLSGVLMNLWVVIGSHFMPPVNFPYPPTSTAGCSDQLNWTDSTRAYTPNNFTTLPPTQHVSHISL